MVETESTGQASLDRRGLKVFLSYSRRDLDCADQLVLALEALGYTIIIDRKGIHGAEKWEARLRQMILEADTVVFLMTPASATSDVCRWEVDQALECRKRIVPVLGKPLEGTAPHQALRDLNYIHFYPEPALPGSGWGGGLARLHATLCVDIEWIREHTRVSEMAGRWEAESQAADFLARGSELAHLQHWRDARPANAPELTLGQRAFIQVSEQAEDLRQDQERRQLADMRTAQTERSKALEASGRAQEDRAQALKTVVRRTIIGIVAAGMLSLAVGVAGFYAYRNGERSRLALLQVQEERLLQDRMIRMARNREYPSPQREEVNVLAKRYEGETVDHFGTDFQGGVYYGTFRIKAGPALDEYFGFLHVHQPGIRMRLDEGGGAAAALRADPKFFATWRALAVDPATSATFAESQAVFVKRNTYDRIVKRLSAPPVQIDVEARSLALQAVIYSIAVQYGPGTSLVKDALAGLGDLSKRSDREIIVRLFEFRDKVDRYFPEIQTKSANFAELIRERNRWEQKDALYILAHPPD